MKAKDIDDLAEIRQLNIFFKNKNIYKNNVYKFICMDESG